MPIKCLCPLTPVLFSTRLYRYRIALRPNMSISIRTPASPLRLFIINFRPTLFLARGTHDVPERVVLVSE